MYQYCKFPCYQTSLITKSQLTGIPSSRVPPFTSALTRAASVTGWTTARTGQTRMQKCVERTTRTACPTSTSSAQSPKLALSCTSGATVTMIVQTQRMKSIVSPVSREHQIHTPLFFVKKKHILVTPNKTAFQTISRGKIFEIPNMKRNY